MGKLYHSTKEGLGLQRPQDFRHFYPYSVFKAETNLTINGENK
jgi:hypothetical protein